MITLQATYDNGQILITEKEFPHIKAKAEIKIFDEVINKSEKPLYFHKIKGNIFIQSMKRTDTYEDRI